MASLFVGKVSDKLCFNLDTYLVTLPLGYAPYRGSATKISRVTGSAVAVPIYASEYDTGRASRRFEKVCPGSAGSQLMLHVGFRA